MKILVIGCGGVGSWFINEIAEKIGQEQITFDELISIADSDIVELEQLRYQNFREDEIGRNKAEVLAERCKAFGVDIFKAIPKRITKESQLKGYEFFVLCVDNEGTRGDGGKILPRKRKGVHRLEGDGQGDIRYAQIEDIRGELEICG